MKTLTININLALSHGNGTRSVCICQYQVFMMWKKTKLYHIPAVRGERYIKQKTRINKILICCTQVYHIATLSNK